MPPKTKYTKNRIITSALKVVEENGLNSLTARSVARKLRSSTAPVYSQFATMDALALEVMKETQKLLLEYTSRPYTDRVFLNMGTGVAMFASEHPLLYKALMLESNSYGNVVSEFVDILQAELIKDRRFVNLSDGERSVLLRKMWTFTHGLASLISVGLIRDCNQDYIVKTLMDVGSDVIGATLAKHAENRGSEQS
jgi:AcrR family transcriptional regulator